MQKLLANPQKQTTMQSVQACNDPVSEFFVIITKSKIIWVFFNFFITYINVNDETHISAKHAFQLTKALCNGDNKCMLQSVLDLLLRFLMQNALGFFGKLLDKAAISA